MTDRVQACNVPADRSVLPVIGTKRTVGVGNVGRIRSSDGVTGVVLDPLVVPLPS